MNSLFLHPQTHSEGMLLDAENMQLAVIYLTGCSNWCEQEQEGNASALGGSPASSTRPTLQIFSSTGLTGIKTSPGWQSKFLLCWQLLAFLIDVRLEFLCRLQNTGNKIISCMSVKVLTISWIPGARHTLIKAPYGSVSKYDHYTYSEFHAALLVFVPHLSGHETSVSFSPSPQLHSQSLLVCKWANFRFLS